MEALASKLECYCGAFSWKELHLVEANLLSQAKHHLEIAERNFVHFCILGLVPLDAANYSVQNHAILMSVAAMRTQFEQRARFAES